MSSYVSMLANAWNDMCGMKRVWEGLEREGIVMACNGADFCPYSGVGNTPIDEYN